MDQSINEPIVRHTQSTAQEQEVVESGHRLLRSVDVTIIVTVNRWQLCNVRCVLPFQLCLLPTECRPLRKCNTTLPHGIRDIAVRDFACTQLRVIRVHSLGEFKVHNCLLVELPCECQRLLDVLTNPTGSE